MPTANCDTNSAGNCPPCFDCLDNCPDTQSGHPITYATGAVLGSAPSSTGSRTKKGGGGGHVPGGVHGGGGGTSVAGARRPPPGPPRIGSFGSSGFGAGISNASGFGNTITRPGTGVQGNSFFNAQISYLSYSLPTGVSNRNQGNICAIGGLITTAVWFKYAGGTYTPMFNSKHKLTLSGNKFYLLDPSGYVSVFYDFVSTTGVMSGKLYHFIDPDGHITAPTYDPTTKQLTGYVRSDGGVNSDGFLYSYYASGANTGQMQYVTHQVDGANVQQSSYTYYDGITNASNGGLNDLESELIQEWDVATSSWVDIGTNYYRYWTSNTSPGVIHGLKYVVGPEAYARMVADGLTPETATDTQVGDYADFYYEYDTTRRVTKEVVDAGNQTYIFTYTSNGYGGPDYNYWKTKTVETLPNGATNIVYSNFAGQTMLIIYQSGTDNWYTFHKYDSSGNIIMTAESSAITGYDETSPDLLKYVSGSYTYLNSTGLIYTYQYYTTTGSGGVAGYLQYEQVQQGQGSTPTILREYQYTSQTVSGAAGGTIYKRSKVVCYPSATDQTIQLNCVIYSYTWYSGTFQVQQQTTTWPSVDTTQNGSGSANSRNQYFNEYGLMIWARDERGFLTNYTWDIARGGITQRIDDVNTSLVPAPSGTGWTTPTGGGLHLISDYEVDNQGRMTQELGPSYTVDIGGTATTVRRARWAVYLDASQMVYEGSGYATGSGPSYTYTLINPVKVTQLDHIGRVVDEIMATRASTSGALSASDTFAQSSWVRWKHFNYDKSGLLTFQRQYHLIPSSGDGSSGTNYDETDYAYDSMEQLLRQESPGGTITRLVYDERERVSSVWVGTDDTGATASNPSGSGSPNNMVQIVAYQYDGGAVGGNDNLTQQTLYDGSGTRVTTFGYDYRDRLTSKDGEIDFYEAYTYDNLNRITQMDRKNTTSSGALVARTQTKYDNAGRVYQRLVYSVASGTAGNSLIEKFWYDPSGNLMKHVPLGTLVFEKKQFDGLNRVIASYLCYNTSEADTNYSAAGAITGDTVLNQTELTYDACSNLIETTSRERFHNATGTGALTTPGGSQPKARVSYKTVYPDAIGRIQAGADYGTNAAASFTRPTTIPARSATVLVTSLAYNSRGEAYQQTDPAGTVNQRVFDDAGRQTQLTENYVSGGTNPDQNRLTNYAYNADGRLATLTAINSVTGDQVTTWQYGTTLADSDVASNDLLSAKQLPDNSSGSDQVTYKYNRLGQVKEVDDQMGTVRTLEYDALGRPQHDCVTTLGSGVDGSVRRVTRSYEVRGMLTGLTSYNNATVGSGTVVNDVKYVYNGFGQLTTEYQSHSGAVNTSTSPKVQYAYANGSSGYARRNSMASPDSTQISYGYGSAGAASDVLNRIEQITNGSTVLAGYSFLGANKPVITTYPEVI